MRALGRNAQEGRALARQARQRRQAKGEAVDLIKATLQQSAKWYSKDGMTGISDQRALHLALDVYDALTQAKVIK